jgi:hypothetical protein
MVDSRMRGPTAWVVEADGSIDVTVGCRACGWAAEKHNVPESEVHEIMTKAARVFMMHTCGDQP